LAESATEYPRVLVVAGPAFGSTQRAVTLNNLFRGWPVDRIAQVHGPPQPDSHICQRYWQVSPADVPIDRAVRTLMGGSADRFLGHPSAGLPPGLGKAVSGEPLRISAVVHGIASSWADVFRFRLPRVFWDWVTDFRPDVIYSSLGRIRIMNLVLEVADRLSKPVVPHFMDDWPSTHYRAIALSFIPRQVLLSRLRAILRRSPIGMAIGEAMAEEYRRRYGIPFEAFMNCVETPAQCPVAPTRDNHRSLKLVYVGGLHLNRWRSIQDVGKASATLSREGLNVETIVYTSASDLACYADALAATPATRIGGSLAPEEVLPRLQAADILVHVESFDPKARTRTRLSVSTKIPQYMSAGRPILGYGPGEVASCRYIQDCGCGRVVGRQDSAALVRALRELASDGNLRASLGHRGWEVASQRHNADKERERFRHVLATAAAGGLRSTGTATTRTRPRCSATH
jgi:glycosyltransferase involved in cell wall biosynthesis